MSSSKLQQMLDLTIKLANVNSGSHNIAGIKQVAELLKTEFLALGCEFEVIKLSSPTTVNDRGEEVTYSVGPMLRFWKRPQAVTQVLLVGHMDTVFAEDHSFQQVKIVYDLANETADVVKDKSTADFTAETAVQISTQKLIPKIINGPGVTDMKGGIVVMLEALRALESMPCADKLGWEVLLNSDEEIGSAGSKPYLMERAKHFDVGLVFEPAIDEQGTLAGERKGSGDFTLVARGKSAHAGRELHKGRNAICSLAQLITEIHALNARHENLTINIGSIHSGGPINVVPDLCVAKLNLRFANEEDEAWVLEKFNNLITQISHKTEVEISLHGGFIKKPKKITGKTEKLYQIVQKVGAELQKSNPELSAITWQPTGGCCDGNNLAEAGLPNVDTLGVRGGKIHSADEYLVVASLSERTLLTAGILKYLAEKGFE